MKHILSYHQERIWFINEFEKGKLYDKEPTYHNIPLIINIKGICDFTALEEASRQVIQRHEILQIQIKQERDRIIQTTFDDFKLDIQKERIEQEIDQSVMDYVLEYSSKPFNLEEDFLVRALLVCCNYESIYCLTFHNLLVDRISVKNIYTDILSLYESLSQKKLYYPIPYFQYIDFLTWQRSISEDLKQTVHEYWKTDIEGRYASIELPTDRPRESIHLYEPGYLTVQIGSAVYNELLKYSIKEDVLMSSIFFGLFNFLLHKYSNQDKLLIGTYTPNRVNSFNVIGPVANLFPVISILYENQSFSAFIKAIHTSYKKALLYSQYPFDLLVRELNVKKDMSRTALFDVLFYFDNEALPYNAIDGTEFSICETNSGYGKYDLNTLVYPNNGDGLDCVVVYNKLYYNEETIANMFEHYVVLVNSFLENVDTNTVEFSLLTEKENFTLDSRNNTNEENIDADIIYHWNRQVLLTPNNISVSFCGKELSYLALDKLSTNIAISLNKKYGIIAGDYVIVMLHNSENLIAVLLGILKCGAAYIPVDPATPLERLNYIIRDSSGKAVVYDKVNCVDPENGLFINIKLEDVLEPIYYNNWQGNITPESNAYIIYTSGTTGKPKGCVITHKNVVSLIKNNSLPFDFSENDIWLLAHSYSFDFSVWEIFGAILFGGKLIVPNEMSLEDISAMRKLIVNEKITILNQTPSVFNALIAIEKRQLVNNLDSSLRIIIFGGERLDYRILKDWIRIYTLERVSLINMYGITETTVHVTFYKISNCDVEKHNSIIGRPLPGVRVHLFDKRMMQVPLNVVGEMFIEGHGVTKGYLNRPELTNERFCKHPYENVNLYKSGDLAKWSKDGQLIYEGRIDYQVKIRGYRIELTEIEHVIQSFSNVQDIVVGVRDSFDTGKYLVGYIIYERELEDDYDSFKQYLHSYLPDYMVPSYFIQIKEIPLTINQKVNYVALSSININNAVRTLKTKNEVINNDIEIELINICSKVLKIPIEKISVYDNFFDIGGQSISAVFLSNEVMKQLCSELPIKNIFTSVNLKDLAAYIQRNREKTSVFELPKTNVKPYYLASYTQKSIYLMQASNKKSTAYNMPYLIELGKDVDVERALVSLKSVIKRHESFYTSFEIIDKKLVQHIGAPSDIQVDIIELDGPLDYNYAKALVQPFELDKSPLIRCVLIHTTEEKRFLFLDIHHIICDAISINILTDEFIEHYRGNSLSQVKFQYKDYSEYLYSNEFSDRLNMQREFWLQMWSDDLTVNSLKGKNDSNHNSLFEGAFLHFELDKRQTDSIRQLSKQKKSTVFVILFSLFNILLRKMNDEDIITIGVPLLGRNLPDLSKIVGCFANLMFIKTNVDVTKRFDDFLEMMKSKINDVHENQNYPFDQIKKDVPDATERIYNSNIVVFQLLDSNEFPVLLDSDFKIIKDIVLNETYKYDMFLNGVLKQDRIEISVMINENVYEKKVVNNLMDIYTDLINYFLEKESATILSYPIEKISMKMSNDFLTDLECGFDL